MSPSYAFTQHIKHDVWSVQGITVQGILAKWRKKNSKWQTFSDFFNMLVAKTL
jgi:hypothetical protein